MRAFLPLCSEAASRSRTLSQAHADPSPVQTPRAVLGFEGQSSGSKRAKCCPLQYPALVWFVLSSEAQLPPKPLRGDLQLHGTRQHPRVPRLGTTALRHVHAFGGAEQAHPSPQMGLSGEQRMESPGSRRG